MRQSLLARIRRLSKRSFETMTADAVPVTCQLIRDDCVEVLPQLSGSLVIGSPEYCEKGYRYIGGQRRKWSLTAWVDWMLEVVDHSLTAAPVAVFVVNDPYRDGKFIPASSTLEAECYRRGVIVADRPLIWNKNAPPNRKDYWSNCWEKVLVFKREATPVPVWNWEAIAEAPRYSNGGDFRQRDAGGQRRKGGKYPRGKLARPKDVLGVPIHAAMTLAELRAAISQIEAPADTQLVELENQLADVVRVTVGGGHLGHRLAHENEAPFPEKLVTPCVLALTNPGDTVIDPFSGSGTTVAVACRHGRRGIGIDIRDNQIELAVNRLTDELGVTPEVVRR